MKNLRFFDQRLTLRYPLQCGRMELGGDQDPFGNKKRKKYLARSSACSEVELRFHPY
jgi:hypothetical protein